MLNKITSLRQRNYWLLVLGVFGISRVATWFFPFDSDHWIFYYIGRRWSEGATLYIDMWDHKSPLIFVYNGLLNVFFGNNIVLHRIFFTIIALIAIYIFYKAAYLLYEQLKLKNTPYLARLSTLVFAFLTNLSQFTNSGNNNENLGLLFLIACFYFYFRYRANIIARQYLLYSGVAASFVILLKANFIILLIPIVIDLIMVNRKNVYRMIAGLCYFALASLFHLLIWVFYFKQTGTFKQFYIAAFEFNSKYIKALGWDLNSPGIIIFLGILGLFVLFFSPFIVAGIKRYFDSRTIDNLFVAIMAVCPLVFIVLAGTFYSHYFLITIPIFCLVFGALYKDAIEYRPKILKTGLVAIAAVLLLVSYKQLYNSYFGDVRTDAKDQTIVAEYLKAHMSDNDTFFAYVYGATLYRLAERNSGSRFISASHLLIDYKYNFGYDFNRQFIFDMVDSEANYVVVSSDPDDLYRQENPVAMRFINNNYHLETQLAGYDILIKNR